MVLNDAYGLEGRPWKGIKRVAKDKKKKGKKSSGGKASRSQSPSVAERFKAISENPAVAEFVSSALLATAAALKDASRVRRVASEAGGELSGLVKEGAERGQALWEMALQVGRRSLDNLTDDDGPKKRTAAKRSPTKRTSAKRTAVRKPAAKKSPVRKTAARAVAKPAVRTAGAKTSARGAATATKRKSPAKPRARAAARKPATRRAPRKPASS